MAGKNCGNVARIVSLFVVLGDFMYWFFSDLVLDRVYTAKDAFLIQ